VTDAAAPVQLPVLTPREAIFRRSLVPGPRPTGQCEDAITIGALIRRNLVAWDEPDHRHQRRRRHGTFGLTEAGVRALGCDGLAG